MVIVRDPLSTGAANCSVAVSCLWDCGQVMMCFGQYNACEHEQVPARFLVVSDRVCTTDLWAQPAPC